MDQDKTVRLTADETVALTSVPPMPTAGEPTAFLGSGEPTARLGPGATARLTGDETVAAPGQTAAVGQPTATGEPTFPAEPTVRLSAQPTIHLAPPPAYSPPSPAERTTPAVPTAPAGRTTSGTRYVTARAGDTRAGDPPQAAEVRFGPGVPAPATAPGWRPAAPARPRRSPWRLVSSILSTLLTIALLVVVGLYLWQRLSPVEVTSVSVAVPQPPGQRCDTTVDVVATVTTNGNAGTLRYQWLRSGTEPTAVLTERIGRGQRSATLHLKWAFSGVGTTTETATINITEPSPMQAQTTVTYDCPRD